MSTVPDDLLKRTLELAREYLDGRDRGPVWPTASVESLRAALGRTLPDEGIEPLEVVADLSHAARPGLVSTTGPRYFGFVTGPGESGIVAAGCVKAPLEVAASVQDSTGAALKAIQRTMGR